MAAGVEKNFIIDTYTYTRISSPEKSRNNTRGKISYFYMCVQ